MGNLMNYPLVVFVLSFFVLWLAAWIGVFHARRGQELKDGVREDFGVVVAATLTLLGLIVGFSFSMAVSRYDQRKNYEEAEANAIGTEYVRADLLPPADAAKVRALLKNYLDQRILSYETRDQRESRRIDARTAQLQTELWSAVMAPAATNSSPLIALATSGMNDVLNSQGYSQAAARNRIPPASWALMVAIAICCNVLIGFGARNPKAERNLLLILPTILSVAFLLIADIDSPHGGLIRVKPDNLASVAEPLRGHI